MQTLTVHTDIHCQSCVNKLQPHLENDPLIEDWEADLGSEVKKLKVSGEEISKERIQNILAKEGYSIINNNEVNNGGWFLVRQR